METATWISAIGSSIGAVAAIIGCCVVKKISNSITANINTKIMMENTTITLNGKTVAHNDYHVEQNEDGDYTLVITTDQDK